MSRYLLFCDHHRRPARVIAKGGRNLPANQSVMRAMEIKMGSGETMDFEVVRPGPLRLRVISYNTFETTIDVK